MNGRARGVKRKPITERYFQWICGLVLDTRPCSNSSWELLFRELHHIKFTWILPMDENRAEDGEDLRYRFGYENRYSERELADIIGDGCSVLEMMVALALRCEEHIMIDPEIDTQTGRWFFDMLKNLDLLGMDDEHFDPVYVHSVIDRFLTRQYEPDGKGGLFSLPGDPRDLRRVDIWYQMMWYLTAILYGRR